MKDRKEDFDQLLQPIKRIYEEKIPFNRLLNLKVDSLTEDDICIKIVMREELIGNFVRGTLHGGVVSSVLDVAGGLIATVGLLKKMAGCSLDDIRERTSKIGTVDLRVDYLRPGMGKYYLATGSIMRMGNKVVVTRTSLTDDQDVLIAVGTGTYMLG